MSEPVVGSVPRHPFHSKPNNSDRARPLASTMSIRPVYVPGARPGGIGADNTTVPSGPTTPVIDKLFANQTVTVLPGCKPLNTIGTLPGGSTIRPPVGDVDVAGPPPGLLPPMTIVVPSPVVMVMTPGCEPGGVEVTPGPDVPPPEPPLPPEVVARHLPPPQ